MSDPNDGKKIIGGLVSTGLFIWLVNKYGLLNVLFWGALALVVLLFVGLNLTQLMANSGYDVTWNKVKYADSIYYHHTAEDTVSTGLDPQLLVRPIRKSDIEAMQIAKWEKNKMIDHLDTTGEPLFISARLLFSIDSMYKYHTAFVGTFVKKDSLKSLGMVIDHGGEYWYAIKPDTTHAACCYTVTIPKGYVLADKEHYYVPAGQVRLEEQAVFVSKKEQTDTIKTVVPEPKKTLKKHKKHKKAA